ncbi:MAG: TetR/AcrR family transcriptional regulator [Porticoccaceae bacterium]|jgi:AcrR family transcriptional regulator|nr:TetR/AcrR family transcriptional regulator [Porticoccaceae bacterium]
MAVGLAKKTSRGDLKRKRILEALRRCIIAKGYAKTTLAEIAIEAELYPSHVLYYFSGKEAILEFYFAQVSSLFRRRLNSFKDEAPSEKIRSLTDFFFADNAASHSEIGFMLECFGVAVNDEIMKGEKAALDVFCKTYLADMFKDTPCNFITGARASAEIAYAILIGLRTAVYFDDSLDIKEARGLYLDAMIQISGLAAS